jgi:UDP-glucose 4-epimerase
LSLANQRTTHLEQNWQLGRITPKPVGRIRNVLDMILLTGGAGYIGSHACMALLDAGHDIAVDNLSNCNQASLQRVQSLCGRPLVFRRTDICNEQEIYEILRTCEMTAVIHLAGLKAVGDSNVRSMS